MAANLRQNADASISFINELDSKEVARVGGPRVADASTTSPTFRIRKDYIVPLTATAGIGAALFSIQNNDPAGVAWYVESVMLDVQTGSTASATCKCDQGTLGTSSGTTVISAYDLSTAGLFNSLKVGSGSQGGVKVANGNYLNLILVSGSATGLVGMARIGITAL